MSGSGPRREVAYRLFGAEFNDATYTYAESDEERAPNYLVTPTGARVNRLFVVGVLTEIEEVSDDVLRARVVDPTGAFVIYAGQYQPDALAFFERSDPPTFVALTGKARTFQPEGSDRVFTSIRPETVNEVDADTRDRWVVQTAEHTLERVALFAKVLERHERGEELQTLLRSADVQPGLAEGIPRAIEEYGTTTGYLASMEELAVDATRLVAGEIDAVEREDIAPEEGGEAEVDTSFADDISLQEAPPTETAAEPGEPEVATEPEVSEESVEAEEPETSPEPEVSEETEVTEKPEEPASSGALGEQASEESQVEEAQAAETPTAETPAEDTPSGETGTKDSPELSETDGVEPAAEEELEETDEMYELSEEERAEVEENYDVGFESGAEIESPESTGETSEAEPAAESTPEGAEEVEQAETAAHEPEEEIEGVESEAEAETPDVTEEAEASDADEDAESPEADPSDQTAEEESEAQAEAPEAETEEEATDASDISGAELEDIVIETMEAEAGDDGIPKGELIDHVQSAYDVDQGALEEAIQDALLGGRCFESGDDRLKPI